MFMAILRGIPTVQRYSGCELLQSYNLSCGSGADGLDT